MRGKPGYLVSIDTGGFGLVRHAEQEQQFRDVRKSFMHYLDEDFHQILVDGKPKTGLIATYRLKIIGYAD